MNKPEIFYLVDDDDDCRFLIKEAIQQIGISVEVLEAENGQALFDILQEEVDDAVLLIDVNMPVMNGLETIQALKKAPQWSSLRVFVFSSSDDQNLQQLVKQLGALKFYTKPGHFDEYINLIEDLFGIKNGSSDQDLSSFKPSIQ
jgi:CheY-like chemotaxis protein